jgi:hypothetical protein
MQFFRIFLYPFDISPELLWESTSCFGYNPRLCFKAACSVNILKSTKRGVMSRIRGFAAKEDSIWELPHFPQEGDSDVSHSIVEISPQTESRFFSQCNVGAVSRWALDLFLKAFETQQADAVTAFYHYISGMSDAASLRGHLFERQVLNHLDGIKTEHNLPIRGLSSPEQMTWSYRGPIPCFNFLRDSDFIEEITKAVQNKKPLHLVPSALDFPAVGSIFYHPNEVLTCIQTTIRSEHSILVSGLQRIQSWIEPHTSLAGLHPSKERPWRFIFIVPSDEASFELQQFRGDDAQGEWAGKVHQYVLGLDVVGKKPKECF